jgi:hypothetical protein
MPGVPKLNKNPKKRKAGLMGAAAPWDKLTKAERTCRAALET